MSSIAWLHCNKCAVFKKQTFNLTECGHLLCMACNQRAINQGTCPICHKRITNVMPLDNNTPPGITRLFSDENLCFPQILKFQNKQYDHILEHLKKRVTSAENELEQLKKETAGQYQRLASLDQQMKTLNIEDDCMSARLGMPSGSRMDMSIYRNGLNAIRREPPRFQLHHNNPLDLQHHELYGRRANPLKPTTVFALLSDDQDSSASNRPGSSTGAVPKKISKKKRY